jgi:hypothetical protein
MISNAAAFYPGSSMKCEPLNSHYRDQPTNGLKKPIGQIGVTTYYPHLGVHFQFFLV